jgi:hypothetical protein
MRLRDLECYTGQMASQQSLALSGVFVHTRIVPITWIELGRIVSISRGSPPPEQG